MNTEQQTYWSNFYKQFNNTQQSNFATFVKQYFDNDKYKCSNLLDCGCGNGRDSYYFSKYFNVTGIDTSFIPNNISNCNFSNENFCNYNKTGYDVIYSRFTFHSITDEQHEDFLCTIKSGQFLCIETRSTKSKTIDKVYGDNHFRNYTDKEYIINLMNKYNFDILYICETNDIAVYKDENPYCIRLIAKKI
jgi:ubiquinone/menaquinone biosynthesis C-methylase UbiE